MEQWRHISKPYLWSNGATTAITSVSPTVTTTYTVTVTDSKGCTRTDAVVVTVNPLPSVDAGADREICYGFSSTLTAVGSGGTPGYTYAWSNGVNTASQTVSPLVTTTYTVTVTDSKGCTSTDAVTVTVNPLPSVDAGADREICYGFSSTLTAIGSGGTPGYTYLWSNGATTASTSVSPSVTTTYTVTVTDSKGCTSTDAVTVTVNPLPSVDAGADREICYGFSSTLTAVGSGGTPVYTYAWSNGVNTASQTVSPTVTTTYTVTVTDSKGCTKTDAVVVTVNPLPSVDAGADREICYGFSSTLTAVGSGGTPGYTYLWSNGATTASTSVSPTVTTTYTVTVTDTKGCTSTDAVTVTVNPLPSVDAGADREICYSFSSTLTAIGSGGTPVYTYAWSNGVNTASQTVSPTVTTTYTVTVTDSKGCTKTDAVVVTVNPLPSVDAGADREICYGFSSTLTAVGSGGTPGYIYLWSNGATTAITSVSPSVTTTYTVTVTDSKGCTRTDAVVVTVNPLPSVDAGADREICYGFSSTLTAVGSGGTPVYTYAWSNGVNTASQTVSPIVTTTYTVTVTDSKGCTSTDAVTVTVNPLPSVDAGADREICYGFSSTLTAVGSGGTPGYTYLWSNGATTAITSVSPTVTTTYTVTVTDSKGCTSTDAVTVTVNPLPSVDAGADREICYGFGSTLTAIGSGGTPGYSYLWSNGATTASTSVSPTVTTTYTVTVTDSKGCTSTDAVVVTVNPLPEVNAGPDVEICYGFSSTLTSIGSGGTPGYTYVWSNGATTASTSVSPTVTTTYTVTVTDTKGCTRTDAVVVTVNPLPSVDAGADREICYGFSSTLTAIGSGGTPGYTYLWSNGATTASTSVSPTVTTTYTVTVTDSKGCTSTDAVVVTVNPLPSVDAGADREICYGFSSTLIAVGSGGTPGYTYLWSNGATTASTSVSPTVTTTYTVTVTDSKGCTSTDAVTVTVNPLPSVDAGADREICYGFSSTLTAVGSGGTPGYTYLWNNGATTASTSVSPTVTTTYTVTVTDSKGCTSTDAVVVTVNPLPEVNAGPDVEICYGFSSTLTAIGSGGTPGYTYVWSNGATTASTSVSPLVTTTYTVTVTDTKGCTSTDAVVVTVNPLPSVDAGADREICYGFSSTLTAVGSGGTPGYTYLWSNGATTAITSVSPTVTTTYTVTVTDSKGCTSTDAVVVTVNPLPSVDAGADREREICYGFSSTLTAVGSGGTPGYTYLWSNGATTASTSVSPSVTTTYTVTVTDSKGCTSTDAVVVTVNPLPSVDAGADTEICYGFSSTLTAIGSGGTPGYTYLWSNGATTASTSVSPIVTTTYTVTVTDSKGCTSTDAVVVTVNPLPSVDAGADREICYGFSSR
ncbi:MAG: hypothetical protein IPO65_04440 [Saprospiraceae bacterium]|nr:hypothetical protein [Saprospiraceae bacterium]